MGASDAEIHIHSGTAREVVIRDGEIEKAENASGRALSVRAFIGKRSAAASYSFDEDQDLSPALEELIAAARATPEDPYSGIASPDQLQKAKEQNFDQFDPTPLLEIDELRKRALILEKSATGKEIKVDQAGTTHTHFQTYYLASNGFEIWSERSSASQSVVAIHQGQILTRDYASNAKIYLSDLEPLEETGQRALERTWQSRNPSRAPSGNYPIIFDERIASSLISHLLGAMNASTIAKRASWLIDYEEDILPANWQIIETPHRLRKSASAIYDAEGFVKKEQPLIKSGRPQTWISNLSSARQLDIPTSGHAIRSGVNTGAAVQSLKLDAPLEPIETLLKDAHEGLYVTGFIGATINPHTGDYSRGVNGFWIKDGALQYPINETTIASNLKIMLPALRAANDADENRNYVIPTLATTEMAIAGA